MNSSTPDHFWKMRAALGIIGQGFVLASSVLSGRFDAGVAGFAACNLTANAIALRYGASRREDLQGLAYLKDHVDTLFGASPLPQPAITTDEAHTLWQHIDSTLAHHASKISIALRYIGAANMMGSGIAQGNAAKITGASLAITGKTLALSQYTQSPYDTHTPDTLESLRQHGFKAGALTEALAYGIMAYHGYQRFAQASHPTDQLLFGLGQSCFVLAYLTRFNAQFETLHINHDALSDHIAAHLAPIAPPEREAMFDAVMTSLRHIHSERAPSLDCDAVEASVDARLHTPRAHIVPGAQAQHHRLAGQEAKQAAHL